MRGPLRIESDALARIALALALAAAAVLVLHLTRGTTLWFDEWVWVMDRRGSSAGTFLEPHNGHFSLVPIVLYKLLFATAGLDDYVPYRVMIIAAHALCAGLVFVYARRRVGGLGALVAAGLILTLGPAWQNFLWPFQVGWLVSLAAGLGALLLLDREDRAGDVSAAVLLAVALASSGLGIPIAAGLLVELLWGRRSLRATWIAAVPLALYAAWWLVYQDTEVIRGNIFLVPGFTADGAAGALGALTGLADVRTNADGLLMDGGTFAWGRPLAVAGVALVAWRLARMGPVPARVFTLLAIPLAFWMLTGLQRAHVGVADSSRYLYVGALFVVLLAIELLRGVTVPRWPAVAVVVAAGLAMFSNLGDMRTGARYLRAQAPLARGDLAALELARASVPPGYDAKSFPGTPFITLRADAYFAAAKAYGTPAYTPAELAAAPESARGTADAELEAIHDVEVAAAPATAPAEAAPTVEAVSGGSQTAADGCVRFRPNGAQPAVLRLTVPPGGLLLKAVGGPAKVSVRRFATVFPAEPLTTLSGSGVLKIDPDRAPQPWHVQLTPAASAEACSVA